MCTEIKKKMFTDLSGAFMLLKNLLTYKQLLHINA